MTTTSCYIHIDEPWPWPPQPMFYYQPDCWTVPPIQQDCHGCDGKGWVFTRDGEPVVCPVCKGSGKYPADSYTITWG